ncbi:hypothetical protein M885DRAFT_511513 [Pelagophyceae sp. CCMP2097]|nr:hypothetical protein M885DRAFT_511513 [Pelagophyceae sp. CCMP2097]|mmetsp:Transcript_24013/g.82103  ORF Transcript_24013/g.82103 Transcript_24013/m.82103 type:complete len:217 (+) Transcript_24013:264-914(+)
MALYTASLREKQRRGTSSSGTLAASGPSEARSPALRMRCARRNAVLRPSASGDTSAFSRSTPSARTPASARPTRATAMGRLCEMDPRTWSGSIGEPSSRRMMGGTIAESWKAGLLPIALRIASRPPQKSTAVTPAEASGYSSSNGINSARRGGAVAVPSSVGSATPTQKPWPRSSSKSVEKSVASRARAWALGVDASGVPIAVALRENGSRPDASV